MPLKLRVTHPDPILPIETWEEALSHGARVRMEVWFEATDVEAAIKEARKSGYTFERDGDLAGLLVYALEKGIGGSIEEADAF